MKISSTNLPPFPVVVALAVATLLALQAWFEYGVLAPLATDSLKLRKEIDDLKGKVARSRIGPAVVENSSRQNATKQLEDALAQLETRATLDARIGYLHQFASEHGVTLRKAGYRRNRMPGGIVRHEIQTDLTGGYPAIRQFLRTLLVKDRAAALESLEFNRPTAGGSVNAQATLVLFLRDTP